MSKVRIFWIALILLMAVGLGVRIYSTWPVLQPTLSAHNLQIVGQPPKATPSLSQVPRPPRPKLRPDLATGMIFPQWGPQAYSAADKNWQSGLEEIQAQTAPRWIGLYLQFHQDSEFSTQVRRARDAETPRGLQEGVELAHKLGYHVYVFPVITLDSTHSWAGYIKFTDAADNQAWFNSYWQQLKPYMQACATAGCERFSIATETEGLENSPGFYWHQLLSRVHSVYRGQIVYNMNFSSLQKSSVPAWMSDPLLTEVGVSAYFSLIDQEGTVPIAQLPALWKSRVQAPLDRLSTELGKPVFISEIGYRDTNHAAYNPYQAEDNGKRDDQLQAALYNAALENIATDRKIDGIFIWAWSMQPFTPKNKPAAHVLHQWYEKL